jgi:single-stranded DNA-specific DHH superfamily exonuclease
LEQKIHLILLFLPNEAKDCNLVLRQIDIKKEEQKDIERQIDKEAKGQRDRVTE